VFAVKQTTFVQFNITHVYSTNFIALTYVLHVFGLYFGNIQACQHRNIYRKIQ